MKVIIVKDIVKDNEWGDPSENTFFTYHTFSSFENAKKECMEDFNRIYHYYDKFKWNYPYYKSSNPYGIYIPSIQKKKIGISILFTIYSKDATFRDVVGEEKDSILEIEYNLIDVDQLPCDPVIKLNKGDK